MNRRLLISLVLMCLAVPLIGAEPGERGRVRDRGRHVIFDPATELTPATRADLAGSGVHVGRPLTNGRFLARVETGTALETIGHFGSFAELTPAEKIHASAARAATQGKPFTRVRVFFHDDQTIDAAREAIVAAGGGLEDPLATTFEPLQSVMATVPSTALADLASDERVLVVYGARNLRAENHNTTAATLSRVNLIQQAPYNLSGEGVVLSFFELAPADANHPEFQGRLTIEFTCPQTGDAGCTDSGNRQHATHVAGTMIAAGTIASQSKGMSFAARLHMYRGNRGNWLTQKETSLKAVGSVADNNSWGYVLGWQQEGSTGWTWNEGEELIGGYTGDLNAVLDNVALRNGSLMVHSSGNEGAQSGPLGAPFRHNHIDESNNPTSAIYCYSNDGSGNDCPTPQCGAGPTFCETVRHPTHHFTTETPGGSIGWMASSKNMVAVGSTNGIQNIVASSSRGPTKDGRIKPDLTAKGQSLSSTSLNNSYVSLQGTSMAAPVVTGTMGLLAEQWRKVNGGASPLPVALKALAIAGAQDLGNPGPDYTFGFGFIDGKNSADIIIADGGTGKRVKVGNANTGGVFEYPMTITATQNVRAVLSWFDPEVLPLGSEEVAGKTLVNDLDIKIIDPSGATIGAYVLDPASPIAHATRGENIIDNTEQVEIMNAAPGTYRVIVTGKSVPDGPQEFVVVTTADLGELVPQCTDLAEPNDTTQTAYGPVQRNTQVAARLCSATDVDYFTYTSNKVEENNLPATDTSIQITPTDTPLKVTLLNGSTVVQTLNVPAGAISAITTHAPIGTHQYFVRVEANGAVGNGSYTIQFTYPYQPANRKRSSRH